MRKNLRLYEDLSLLVRDRTRFKGDLSKTVVQCIENVDLPTISLAWPVETTETTMQIMLDDDLHARLHAVAATRRCSVNTLINSAVATCLGPKSSRNSKSKQGKEPRRRSGG